ncbi:MAG: thiamine phosphate synthase [Lysobacterales bacterium]|jgi:thiamine-phosphate pyrophosphorylase
MSTPLRGVYLITPDLSDTGLLLERTRLALEAGLALLQYRNKTATAHVRARQASALALLCREFETPMIVNDDLELAVAVGAAGVHLGGEDASLRLGRERLGPAALVGASCYASLGRAEQAKAQGASYVAFGAFAASPTKPLAKRADPTLLNLARPLDLPIVAIGGVTTALAPKLVAAGADLLAVISCVYDAADPGAVVRELRLAFPEFQGDLDADQPRAV